MYDKELTIFSVFHKEYQIPDCSFIKPIQVGKAISSTDLGLFADDTGTNISAKNKTFNELTALFWIWKNLDSIDSEYIGIAHYRRYFCLPAFTTKKKWGISKEIELESDVYAYPLDEQSMQKITNLDLKNTLLKNLRDNAVIVPHKAPLSIEHIPATIRMHYISNHIREDWWLTEKIVKEHYPEYATAFDEFSNLGSMHCYNMFIADKNFINAYCTWLFNILFELEKVVKLSDYPYQHRVIGFMAERLMNLYLYKNQTRTKSFPVLYFS